MIYITMMLCLFISYLVAISITSLSKILQYPLYKSLTLFELQIGIGNVTNQIRFSLDFNSNYSLFAHFVYPLKIKQIANLNVNITLSNYISWIAKEIIDDIRLISDSTQAMTTVKDFHFYYYYDETSAITLIPVGRIGLGVRHSFINPSFSLIHQLKHLGYINTLSFSIIQQSNNNNNSNNHYLYIGDINEVNNDKWYSCDVNSTFSNWNCHLSSITITDPPLTYHYNTTIDKDDYISLSTTTLYAYAPRAFLSFFSNSIIMKHLKTQQCHINDIEDSISIGCTDYIVFQLGQIVFELDEYSFTFNLSDFWSCYGGYCGLDIIQNPKNDNGWEFGRWVFDRLNITFNYETNQMLFSSTREGVIKKKIKECNIIKVIMIAISIIGSIGIIINGLKKGIMKY